VQLALQPETGVGGCDRRVPRVRENEVVRADQFQAAVLLRFVNDDLRTRGVQLAIHHERKVHEVHAHRAVVRSADAAELQGVAFAR
jgi:hypothetical protein